MTKEEAEKIVQSAWPKISALASQNANYNSQLAQSSYNAPMSPAVFVKLAVALGMLKLDEPKSPDQLIADALWGAFSFTTNPHGMNIFRTHLAAAGLKIVEK